MLDGTTVSYTAGQTHALYKSLQTSDPTLTLPNAFRPGSAGDATYTDGNGHTTVYVLDSMGQAVSQSDAVGPGPAVQRNAENLIMRSTDARGQITEYGYDAKGNVTQIRDEVSTGAALGHLLAFYPFDGNANDASGNNNDGVVTGAALSSGYEGQSYHFNGSSDLIRLPLNINPSVHPQLTMGAWVNVNSANPIRQVISEDNGGFDRSLGIDNRGGGTGWSAFAGTGQVLGYEPVTSGEWTFVAVVYDQAAGTVTLYVNGHAFQKAGSLGAGNTFSVIGANPGFGQYFSGTIDDVFFYDTAMTADEITAIRNGGEAEILGTASGKHYTYDPTFSQVTSFTDELGHQTLYDIDPANGNVRLDDAGRRRTAGTTTSSPAIPTRRGACSPP